MRTQSVKCLLEHTIGPTGELAADLIVHRRDVEFVVLSAITIEEGITHKSAKTLAGNVSVILDVDI